LDHINQIKDDDRVCNLRPADDNKNQYNVAMWETNTSGFKGVGWDKADSNWYARIRFNGKRKSLGRFDCKYEAAKAYRQASAALHGEFSTVK
jgi:hypothetical protein